MMDAKHKTRIVVNGVELTVGQTGTSVSVSRVVGRDRKRKLNITRGINFDLDDLVAITLVRKLKSVAAFQTARCTCDYRLGYSDHAEHCQSIHVAKCDGAYDDDD